MERLERLAGLVARDFNRLIENQDGEDILRSAALIRQLAEEIDNTRINPSTDSLEATSAEETSTGSTVLLVEPEPVERARLAAMLLDRGCAVLEAETAYEALDVCQLHPRPIDLLLVSAMLADASGRELAELAGPFRPEMAVVYMSGYAGDAIMSCGILAPAVVTLAKPVTPGALAATLARFLDPEYA